MIRANICTCTSECVQSLGLTFCAQTSILPLRKENLILKCFRTHTQSQAVPVTTDAQTARINWPFRRSQTLMKTSSMLSQHAAECHSSEKTESFLPRYVAAPGEDPSPADLVNELEARMNQMPASSRPKLDQDDSPPVTSSNRKPAGTGGSQSRSNSATMDKPFEAGSTFEEASNSDLASSLSARFAQVGLGGFCILFLYSTVSLCRHPGCSRYHPLAVVAMFSICTSALVCILHPPVYVLELPYRLCPSYVVSRTSIPTQSSCPPSHVHSLPSSF